MVSSLARAILGFSRAVRYSTGTPARSNRLRSLIQLSGRKSRNATMTCTSPLASVSDTRVWQFAVLPSAEAYCAATPTECVPFFGIAVSSITSTAATDELVGLNEQLRLQRRSIPNASRNKMMQLIIITRRKPLRHRLNALAIARPDQPRHVKRTHPSTRPMAQEIQERLQPAFKLVFPIRRRAYHGRPSKKPTTHESQNIRVVNPVHPIMQHNLPK